MKEITRAERLFNTLQENMPEPTKIDYENINKISFDKIVAFTYASAGAMGDCGGITVVHKDEDLIFYEINRVYNEDAKLVEKVDSTFFKPVADLLTQTDFLFEVDGFSKYDLGHGNSFFIRNEYKNDFDNFLHIANYNSIALPTFIFPILMQATNIFF